MTRGPNSRCIWSGRRGSNPRPTAWKAVTLPLSYSRLRASRDFYSALRRASPPRRFGYSFRHSTPRRRAKRGLPPNQQATKPKGPLNSRAERFGGEGRVRTSVALRRQVYSLLRLTALPPPRNTSRFSRCLSEHLSGVPFL